eukprot:8126773-Alexandrium_andersonii.AAC.1
MMTHQATLWRLAGCTLDVQGARSTSPARSSGASRDGVRTGGPAMSPGLRATVLTGPAAADSARARPACRVW